MQRLGREYFSAVEEKVKDSSGLYFSFFTTDVMLDLISTSIMMYYVSRAGHISGQQAVIQQFISYLFTTRKTPYQQEAMWKLEFDSTLSREVI